MFQGEKQQFIKGQLNGIKLFYCDIRPTIDVFKKKVEQAYLCNEISYHIM